MHRVFATLLCLFVLNLSVFPHDRVRLVKTPAGGQVPEAEIDRHGTLHLAFVKGEDAFYTSSADQGQTFAKPIRINSERGTVHPPNMFRGPDIAVGKNDRVHVIWYVNAYQRKLPHDQWGVFYSFKDPSTGAFQSATNLNHKPSDNFSIAADANGRVAVVWMADGIFLTESTDNGLTFKTEPIPNADPCECCASRALFLADKTLVIEYREKENNFRDTHLLLRGSNDSAFRREKLSGASWQINACPMTGAFLHENKDGLVAGWETKGALYFGRVGRDRTFPPRETLVTSQGKWPVNIMAGDGKILASWKSGPTLHWRLFDSNGTAIGETHAHPSSNAHRHAAIVLQDGTFLVID